jgi:hypothetical protein
MPSISISILSRCQIDHFNIELHLSLHNNNLRAKKKRKEKKRKEKKRKEKKRTELLSFDSMIKDY